MAELTLNLNILDQDLSVLLDAGLNITLAKPLGTDTAVPNVAWQVFRPFPKNTITWEEVYGVYGSNTMISNGAVINQLSDVNPALDNAIYPFTNSNLFGPPRQPGQGQGTYSITNQNDAQPTLTFGLTQGASINQTATGFKPLNAQSVPFQLNGDFTPLTIIYAWVEANIVSETLITQVTSARTKVVFGGGVTTQTLTWDASRGMFVLDPSNSLELDSARSDSAHSVYALGNGVEVLVPMIL
jgi:hypothetical protein